MLALRQKLKCDRIADEKADEAGDTSHCKDSGEDADAERNILRADNVEDNTCEAVRAARDVQQLAEQSAEEKQNHPQDFMKPTRPPMYVSNRPVVMSIL